MPKAVLFDLDDTLFDHRASARAGLLAWQAAFAPLGAASIDELERANAEGLEAVHVRLLAGELSLDEARTLRTRELFARYGITTTEEDAAVAYRTYRQAYDAARGPVPGCREVIRTLAAMPGLRLGIVTNNLVREQLAKLDLLGLRHHFDEVIVSEAVGCEKPDPRIFQVALERLAVEAHEAVMVGDSLATDVQGAERAGIRAVWLDRDGKASPRDPSVLRGWRPTDDAVRTILA